MLLRLLLPTAAAGVAHVLTRLLWTAMEGNFALLFITAVMVSALYGGLAAGLVASLLSALASAFFYLPPQNSFAIGGDDVLRLGAFVAVAVFVSWLSGGRRRWMRALHESRTALERRVADRTSELRDANRRLEEEVRQRRDAQTQILAYQEQLRSSAAEMSIAEERQRRQIAAALHDAVGHRLAVAVMKLRGVLDDTGGPTAVSNVAGVARVAGCDGISRRAPEISRACGLVEEAIAHTRSLTLQLSPPILYELGLAPAVEWLAEQVQAETGLIVTVSDDGRSKPTDEQIRPLLFSAIRELLVNVVKHARARTTGVLLSRDGDYLRVEVVDDGIGCAGVGGSGSNGLAGSATTSGGCFGLFNIRERFEHMGGSFELTSEAGKGCRVTLRAPLVAPARPEPTGNQSPDKTARQTTAGTRSPCQPASC